MLVKERKYSKSDLIYESIHFNECNDNFVILDDKTSKIDENIRGIFRLIEKYNYKLRVIDSGEYSKRIVSFIEKHNIDFDAVLLVGTGGKQVFKNIKDNDIFNNKEIYSVKWNREWDSDISIGFRTNLNHYNLNNKQIILMEDVIASGNTLWTIVNEIRKYGGMVKGIFSILIQESSPIIERSFCPTYSIVMVNKPNNEELDPFWYPPIYSLRHLLYGDSEMSNIYNVLNEKYFNNNDEIELEIKKIR